MHFVSRLFNAELKSLLPVVVFCTPDFSSPWTIFFLSPWKVSFTAMEICFFADNSHACNWKLWNGDSLTENWERLILLYKFSVVTQKYGKPTPHFKFSLVTEKWGRLNLPFKFSLVTEKWGRPTLPFKFSLVQWKVRKAECLYCKMKSEEGWMSLF